MDEFDYSEEEKNEFKVENPHWTQWLPGIGALEAIISRRSGKPSIIETNFLFSAAYHALGIEGIRTFSPSLINYVSNYFK